MPAYERAELTAELRVEPKEPADRAREAAGRSGLAREAGPGALVFAGGREEVLGTLAQVVEAALDAGASTVEVRIEAEGESDRFAGTDG